MVDLPHREPARPQELLRKRGAIFKHESQKDRALFPGPSDTREFWQRAEDRNRETAQLYDKLGLAEYEAIEGFVRWKGDMDAVRLTPDGVPARLRVRRLGTNPVPHSGS